MQAIDTGTSFIYVPIEIAERFYELVSRGYVHNLVGHSNQSFSDSRRPTSSPIRVRYVLQFLEGI